MKTPKTWAEIQRRFPDAALECVGDRDEIVIYTGLTPIDGPFQPATGDRVRPLTDEEISA